MQFAEKYGPWALIVGASEGLGAAFADECAKRGLNVALVARRAEAMAQVAAGLKARHGVEARQIVADGSSPDFLEAVQAGTAGLEIGFMIFNAGYQPGGPFLRIAMEDHLACLRIQCEAPLRMAYWLGRQMAGRGRGGMVFVGSAASLQGMARWVSYSAAKAFELMLGEGLWDELGEHGVTAATYVVGATATPNLLRTRAALNLPEGPARSPEEVAAALFPQLESGPRLYPHPDDKAAAEAAAAMPRAELVAQAGQGARLYFPAGQNKLID